MAKKIIPGTRYQYYDKKTDEMQILIIKEGTDKGVIFDSVDHKVTTLCKLPFGSDEFNDKYIEIIPDGFINIMTTDVEEKPDLYVCVNRASDLANNVKAPAVIARQYMYNNFKAMTEGIVWLGDCVSTVYNYDDANSLESYMEFSEIGLAESVAVYVDSTLDDIVNSIPNIKSFNKFLKWLKDDTVSKTEKANDKMNSSMDKMKDIAKEVAPEMKAPSMNFNVKGLCETVKEFLESVNFMMHFRAIFNITQVDWPVDLRRNKDKEELKLNSKQIKRIEDMFRMNILNPIVIEYAKDIDISKIVSKKHLLLSDSNYIIYLIAYDEGAPYIADEDVLRGMGVK